MNKPTAAPEEMIFGRQAVLEALRYKRLRRVYMLKGLKGPAIDSIVSLTYHHKIPLEYVSRDKFATFAGSFPGHQGVVAFCLPYRYLSLDQLVRTARAASSAPFLILLDHLQDPQNLGSIIRTADAAGVHGLIIPEPRSAKVTPAVLKVAAGAAERVHIALVPNLSRAIESLKKEGFWIYAAEADGEVPYWQIDFNGPLALVVGSEGSGLTRIVREHCDSTLRIPMQVEAASLNVAVAAAVLIYAALAQRERWGK